MNIITKKSSYKYWRERYRLQNERKTLGNEETKDNRKKYNYNKYKSWKKYFNNNYRYKKYPDAKIQKTSPETEKWLKDYDNLYKSKFPDMADYDYEMEKKMNGY